MKKLITTLCIVASSFVSYSQTQSPISDVTNEFALEASAEKCTLHTKSKMELVQIYLNEVKILMGTIPYSSFTLGSESDSTAQVQKVGLDIPMTKYTTKKLDKVSSSTKNMNNTIQNSLFEILPYSDREDIISAILYVQSINKMVKQIY